MNILLRILALIYLVLVVVVSAILLVPIIFLSVPVSILVYIFTGEGMLDELLSDKWYFFPVNQSKCVEFMDWVGKRKGL